MRPDDKSRSNRARIQKIAAICLGALFVALFARTFLLRESVPAKPERAAARERVSAASVAPSPSEGGTWEPRDPGTVRWTPHAADTTSCTVPSNLFKVPVRLKEELSGIKHENRNPAPGPAPKKRIVVKLKGIATDHTSGEHIALIDDELLRAGDRYRGLTVLEIGPDYVALADGEERRVLRLEER